LIVAPNLELPQPPGAPPVAGQKPSSQPPENPVVSADWLRVPPVTPMPRTGVFIIPPSGPGYYSALDLILRRDWPDRPKQPYGPYGACAFSFFDADFRYLDDPNNTQTDWLDWLKRIHPTDDFLLTLGGEYRYRFMAEYDSRLSGKNNFYNLLRERA